MGNGPRALIVKLALFILGAGLLALLFAQFEFSDLIDLIVGADRANLVGAIIAALMVYVVVSTRLRMSLATVRAVPWIVCLATTVRQTLLLVILPVRAGDVAYPVILARRAGISVGQAIGNLMVIRLCDVAVLLAAALFAMLAVLDRKTAGVFVFVAAGGGVLLCVGLLVALPWTLYKIAQLLAVLGLTKTWVHKWLFDARRSTKSLRRSDIAFVLAWSVALWIVVVVLMWFIFRAFRVDITILEALFVVAVLNFATLIPLQTIGGFGLAEGVVAGSLVLLGSDLESAALFAVAVRGTWLLVVIGVGFALMPFGASKYNSPKNVKANARPAH